MKNEFEDYYESVKYLESLSSLADKKRGSKDFDPSIFVKRTRYFLDLVGSPDKKLKIIHIAGTSGKGSVSDLVQQHLTNEGARAGLYTSPFASTSIEKIRVGKLFIDPQKFADIVTRLKPLIDRAYVESPLGVPSYFEAFLIISLIYFVESDCEWAVIETGLGGRYDATNVFEKPVITAITNIDLDHTEILGKTLTKITRDKVGIAKEGSVFITAEQRPHLTRIIRNLCKKVGTHSCIVIKTSGNTIDKNRQLASRIVTEAGFREFDMRLEVKLPCRFEMIQEKPRVILDGAHNDAKIFSTIENIGQLQYKSLITVFAVASDKDVARAMRHISSTTDYLYLTRFYNTHRKSASPHDLYRTARGINKNISSQIVLDPFQATKEAIKTAGPDDIILVTGSFFLAGDVRKLWYPEEYILKNRKIK